MSLPNPNKTVTEARLSEFYTQILPYLGGMPEAVCNKFSKSDLLSTMEKIVGCNTDGKPLYQKTIECGNLPNTTTKNVAHNISNIDVVVGIRGTIRDSSTHRSVPIDAVGQDDWSVSVGANRTNIIITTWQNYSTLTNFSLYVTIQYTKTTDAANSFKWGDENDYSTDEKIVGTNENGEYIYQKMIILNTIPQSVATDNIIVIPVGESVKQFYKWDVCLFNDAVITPIPCESFSGTGGIIDTSDTSYYWRIVISLGTNSSSVSASKNAIRLHFCNGSTFYNQQGTKKIRAIIQYTKTS